MVVRGLATPAASSVPPAALSTFAANEKVIFPFVVEAIVVAGCP